MCKVSLVISRLAPPTRVDRGGGAVAAIDNRTVVTSRVQPWWPLRLKVEFVTKNKGRPLLRWEKRSVVFKDDLEP